MRAVLTGLLPSIGVAVLFWIALRAVLSADRRERAAIAKAEAGQETPQ